VYKQVSFTLSEARKSGKIDYENLRQHEIESAIRLSFCAPSSFLEPVSEMHSSEKAVSEMPILKMPMSEIPMPEIMEIAPIFLASGPGSSFVNEETPTSPGETPTSQSSGPTASFLSEVSECTRMAQGRQEKLSFVYMSQDHDEDEDGAVTIDLSRSRLMT